VSRVLVTGARGLLGSQLVPALRTAGHDVLATDVHLGSDERYMTWDVSTSVPTRVAEFMPEAVYHLAAVCGRVVAEENCELALRTNVLGASRVARLAEIMGARLIHVSTSEVYGTGEEKEDAPMSPQNFYGLSKAMGHQVVQYRYPRATIVVPFMMVSEHEPAGPHRSFFVRAAHAVRHGLPLTVHRGASRSWLHMDDSVRWLIEMLDESFVGQTVNIGSTEPPVDNAFLVGLMEGIFQNRAQILWSDMPERIRPTKTPDLTKQQAMLSPQQVTLTQAVLRMARFMEVG
jgi:nucleoside-diphosphate-sugar epimerase